MRLCLDGEHKLLVLGWAEKVFLQRKQKTNLSSLLQNKATFRNNSFMGAITKECTVENYKTKEKKINYMAGRRSQ